MGKIDVEQSMKVIYATIMCSKRVFPYSRIFVKRSRPKSVSQPFNTNPLRRTKLSRLGPDLRRSCDVNVTWTSTE